MRLLKPYVKPVLKTALLCGSICLISACVTTQGGSAKTEEAEASNTGLAEFDAATKLMQRRRYDEAETALLAITGASPDLAGAWANLGIVYVKQKQPAKAIPALRRAVKLNPGMAVAHNHLGVIYKDAKQYRSAENAYKDAISAQPNYAKAILNLAILYDAQLKRPAEAISSYRNYLAVANLEKEQQAKVLLWIKQAEDILEANGAKQ